MKRLWIIVLACCTISVTHAQVGVYRSSSYGSIKKEKVQRPKRALPTAMIGLTGGAGATISPHVIYPNGALSFDWAVSATPNFALGTYTQWGILENFTIGLQFVGGDFMSNKTAFVCGVGYSLNGRGAQASYTNLFGQNQHTYMTTETYQQGNVEVTRNIVYRGEIASGVGVRFGIITPKHLYMLLDAGIYPVMYDYITDRYERSGKAWYGALLRNETAATITLSFGYAFGIGNKSKKSSNE